MANNKKDIKQKVECKDCKISIIKGGFTYCTLKLQNVKVLTEYAKVTSCECTWFKSV